MTLPTVIIDTNVVVAGLITKNPSASVCRILDAMLSGRLPYLLSPDLLDEYQRVLSRPKISQLHGLNTKEVDNILEELAANAIWRDPTKSDDAPDQGDNHLWSLLKSQQDSILVTGDKMLTANPPDKSSVITPQHFLKEIVEIIE
jgi:putative PIN family toxin of toxin-antitoxin system